MGHFLNVAKLVLEEKKTPLTSTEIVNLAMAKGLLVSRGRAPEEIMKSKLSTDILRQKSESDFMRTEKGKFALRSWGTKFDEYIANRFKKALLDEQIAVFPAGSLRKYITTKGLTLASLENSKQLIAESRLMIRRLAELDTSVIQLISVFVVHHGDRYLTYKRAKHLPEDRLHGFYSAIFGGHLNLSDILPLFDVFASRNVDLQPVRELKEELRLPPTEFPLIKYKGLLYDDSRDVSRQHLGIVYDVSLQSESYEIGERGFLIDPKFETLSEIDSRIEEFENWSVTIIEYERRALL